MLLLVNVGVGGLSGFPAGPFFFLFFFFFAVAVPLVFGAVIKI